jgi:hypothetical protein
VTVLLEKLTVTQLVKKFIAFYGTQRFTTVFIARHWSLMWARCIQSTTFHPISLRSILILFSHLRLGLPSSLYPSGFPTRTLYAFPISPMRLTCTAYLILPDLMTLNNIWWILQFTKLLVMQSSLASCHFIPPMSKYSAEHPVLIRPHSMLFPACEGDQVSHPYKTGKIIVFFLYFNV